MSGYFGDSGNKDVNFMQNWKKNAMSHSIMKIKLNLWDF